jgi:hypothetical protein
MATSRWQVGEVAMYWPEKGDREPCRLEDRLETPTKTGQERWTIVVLVGLKAGRRFVVAVCSLSPPTDDEKRQYPTLFRERLAL